MMVARSSTGGMKVLLAASVLYGLTVPALAAAAMFDNPLGNLTTIEAVLANIIRFFIGLAGLVALMALVIGGVRLILGGFDNEQEAARAKKIIFWAIVGLLVVGLAAVILGLIGGALGLGTGGPEPSFPPTPPPTQ